MHLSAYLSFPSVRIQFPANPVQTRVRPPHSGGGPSFQDSEIWGVFVSVTASLNLKPRNVSRWNWRTIGLSARVCRISIRKSTESAENHASQASEAFQTRYSCL